MCAWSVQGSIYNLGSCTDKYDRGQTWNRTSSPCTHGTCVNILWPRSGIIKRLVCMHLIDFEKPSEQKFKFVRKYNNKICKTSAVKIYCISSSLSRDFYHHQDGVNQSGEEETWCGKIKAASVSSSSPSLGSKISWICIISTSWSSFIHHHLRCPYFQEPEMYMLWFRCETYQCNYSVAGYRRDVIEWHTLYQRRNMPW